MAIATTDVRETGFCNGAVAIAARLHLPPDFDQDRPWPAIVLSAPGSSVQEPVGTIYARKLAERGFVALTFDPSHRVAGGGQANARNRALAQPLMAIVGGRRGSTGQYETGRALYGLARGPDRALVVIPDAGHHDLHHRDECIDPAIERLAPFLHFHLEP